jgi:predicted Zn-dependent protease
MRSQKAKGKRQNILLLVTGYWLLVIGFLYGCATVYNPATQKEELILIDTSSEVFLGRNLDFRISQSYYVIRDPLVNERVNAIGQKIASVSDRQDLKYHFRIIKDKEINAFATPGGYIYVHTGLLDRVEDAELAAVLAHEVGHVAARHIVKKLQAQIGYDILVSFAFRKGGAEDLQKAIGITFDLISLGYSREDELFADKLGIKYVYKAGYSPQAMISMLKKLQALEKDKGIATPLFLRSHPYLAQRIKQAEKEIAALKDVSLNETSPLQQIPEKKTTQLISPAVSETPKPKESTPSLEPDHTKSQSILYGLYKKCPQCGKTYPRHYQYCPKDGTRLVN